MCYWLGLGIDGGELAGDKVSMWRSSGLVARVVISTKDLGQAESSFRLEHVVSRTARIRLVHLMPLEWIQGLVHICVYYELSKL